MSDRILFLLLHSLDQMYLKEGLSNLKMDVERARRGGFVLGAKLVRGAYMISERKVGRKLKGIR